MEKNLNLMGENIAKRRMELGSFQGRLVLISRRKDEITRQVQRSRRTRFPQLFQGSSISKTHRSLSGVICLFVFPDSYLWSQVPLLW